MLVILSMTETCALLKACASYSFQCCRFIPTSERDMALYDAGDNIVFFVIYIIYKSYAFNIHGYRTFR